MEKQDNTDTIWMLVKGWMTFRKVARAILVLIFALVILSLIGFPKEIHQTREAILYTESGKTLSCDIEIQGDVTRYPLKGKSSYDLEASCNGVFFAYLGYDPEKQQYCITTTTPENTTILDIPNDVLVAQLDLSSLFPEQERQRCILVSPVMELEKALELVDRAAQDRPELAESFAWAENGR